MRKLSLSSLIHFSSLFTFFAILQLVWEYFFLEFGIVILIMYEVGFEMRFMDELISLNNKFNKFLHDKFDKKRRRKRRKVSDVRTPI